jgi:hypothetical protein
MAGVLWRSNNVHICIGTYEQARAIFTMVGGVGWLAFCDSEMPSFIDNSNYEDNLQRES